MKILLINNVLRVVFLFHRLHLCKLRNGTFLAMIHDLTTRAMIELVTGKKDNKKCNKKVERNAGTIVDDGKGKMRKKQQPFLSPYSWWTVSRRARRFRELQQTVTLSKKAQPRQLTYAQLPPPFQITTEVLATRLSDGRNERTERKNTQTRTHCFSEWLRRFWGIGS